MSVWVTQGASFMKNMNEGKNESTLENNSREVLIRMVGIRICDVTSLSSHRPCHMVRTVCTSCARVSLGPPSCWCAQELSCAFLEDQGALALTSVGPHGGSNTNAHTSLEQRTATSKPA